jgi:putative ABC transport system ATP-binding protein
MEAITAVVDELDLRADIERLGLDHQVGPAGRLLSAAQRASVSLIRCLVRRPDILVVDGAQVPLGEARAAATMGLLREIMDGRSLFVVAPHAREAQGYDAVVRFEGARAIVEAGERTGPPAEPQAAPPPVPREDATEGDLRDAPDREHKQAAGGVQ